MNNLIPYLTLSDNEEDDEDALGPKESIKNSKIKDYSIRGSNQKHFGNTESIPMNFLHSIPFSRSPEGSDYKCHNNVINRPEKGLMLRIITK